MSSPDIGVTAEYDALSKWGQVEGVAKRIPRADNENGHGCGHNALEAGAVGTAIAVKEYLKKKCSGTTIRKRSACDNRILVVQAFPLCMTEQ